MKKIVVFALAAVLLMGLAACGTPAEDGAQDSTTTTTTTTVGAGETTTTASTTVGTANGDATDTTTTTTASATTGTYAPSGTMVPIGTKPITTVPATTTTTTGKPTTTTAQVEEPGVGTTTVTTTTTTTTTTTVTTTKPTEPVGPYIVLPEVGFDIDVVKQKDRIRVSAVAAWSNEDGSIGVSLTFKNYSSNWITEETDYVEYTCYDKNGNVVQKATKIMLGVIDTKNHSVKEFVFDVPANTAEVRITNSKIVYWTEWS